MKYDCPLCGSFLPVPRDEFMHCFKCDAFVRNSMTYLNRSAEHDHYKLHKNSLDNESYLNFLTPLSLLIKKHVSQGSFGLDFGCGPVFAMEKLLSYSYPLNHYDPFFHPNDHVLKISYDFIILSKVIEHFHHPHQEFKALRTMLKSRGLLFIQTHRHDDIPSINHWYYAKDPTHVFLCGLKTFQVIAEMFNLNIIEITNRCVVLQAN